MTEEQLNDIDKDLYDVLTKCLCNPKDEYISKQNIIDFLENEIKEYSKFIDDATDEILAELQRVLDFVNKGDKE